MTIERWKGSAAGRNRAVRHGGVVYTVATAPGANIQVRTRAALAALDANLTDAGSDQTCLLSAQIFLADPGTCFIPRRVMRCGQDGPYTRRPTKAICRYGRGGQRSRRPSWPQPEGTGRSGRISLSVAPNISTYYFGLSSLNCIPHRLRRTRA